MKLTMPWPPSLNQIWRAYKGRIILSKAARTYYAEAAKCLPVGRTGRPLTGRLAVWMTMCPPARLTKSGQTWDIANREKLLADALTKQRVWLDDSQIDAMIIQRGAPCKKGRVDVNIHVIPPGTQPLL